jgi:multidrug efflux pump subunit AcrB
LATATVVALVFVALGRRGAAIVGSAVVMTLTVALLASWAWGFTLNRVSLFALVFSIGILVDDAIVVVENIHRHHGLQPERQLAQAGTATSYRAATRCFRPMCDGRAADTRHP